MEQNKTTKCAIYISADMKYTLPLEKQLAYILQMIESLQRGERESKYPSPVLVDTYIDYETKRSSLTYKAEWKRLIYDACEGKIDVVFCTSYTAISKLPMDAIHKLEKIAKTTAPNSPTFEFLIEGFSSKEETQICFAFEQTINEQLHAKNKVVSRIKKAQPSQEIEPILKKAARMKKRHETFYSTNIRDERLMTSKVLLGYSFPES